MNKVLTIDSKEALRLYPNASPETKAVFESTFGREFFTTKITDRIEKENRLSYPFFVLEKIPHDPIKVVLNKDYTAEVTECIRVGCQVFPIGALEALNTAHRDYEKGKSK